MTSTITTKILNEIPLDAKTVITYRVRVYC